MGAKYTTLATSGYNTSAPSDAGAQAAENLITWSGIKTKLGDPVKTLADAINTALVSAFDYSARQITTSDTTVAGDHMRCVEIAPTVTTAVTISLGDAATMTNLYRVFIKNSSSRNQTLTRITGGDTLDGVAGSVVLAPGEGRVVQTIGAATGYVTVSRFGPVTDGDAIVAGGTDGTKKVRIEADGLTTATTRVWTAADLDIALGKQPTRQTFTSGSGTYTTPAGATRIAVRLLGPGGGGGAMATNAGAAGSAATTFSTFSAGAGNGGGQAGGQGGTGGAASGGSVNIPGGIGQGGASNAVAGNLPIGGNGAASAFGGAGGGQSNAAGLNAATNSGAGGGGAGGGSGNNSGGGGGSGGYVEAIVNTPAATYSYLVGAGGAGGAAGTFAGGNGAAGIIIVDEFYN